MSTLLYTYFQHRRKSPFIPHLAIRLLLSLALQTRNQLLFLRILKPFKRSTFASLLLLPMLLVFLTSLHVTASASTPLHESLFSESDILDKFLEDPKFLPLGVDNTARDKLSAFIRAMKNVREVAPDSPEAMKRISVAAKALEQFDNAVKDEVEAVSTEEIKELLKSVNWSVDEHSRCKGYRRELLQLLGLEVPVSSERLGRSFTLHDDLLNCALWLREVDAELTKLIEESSTKLQGLRQELKELIAEYRAAEEAGDLQLMGELTKRIQKAVEEISVTTRDIERKKRVKRSFDLESFLQGLFKFIFGVATLVFDIFGEECDAASDPHCGDRKKANDERRQNLGYRLIVEGTDQMVSASNPPDEFKTVVEKISEPEPRPEDAIQREQGIESLLTQDQSELCCREELVESGIEFIPTNDKGPFSYGFTRNEDGLVSRIYLIENRTGEQKYEIHDDLLFYIGGKALPKISLNHFVGFNRARPTSSQGRVLLSGTLSSGEKAALLIQLYPLTHYGKYKVVWERK